ncbi:MAG: alpha/beta hydrolase [Alphaproteobacteria bacterium]|nr:alpha/beta hydrolase [Alphaproteobacteria bacterium]
MTVRRGFADIAEGQMHYRTAGPDWRGAARRPLVLFHGSPESSLALERLLTAIGGHRPAIAFDTLGQGDSARPAIADPDIAYFADAARRAIDALGIGPFDAFGTHTGARIVTELAIGLPGRLGKAILDGMSDGMNPFYVEYVKTLDNSGWVDQDGSQFIKTWNRTRDSYLFWPPYRRDPAHWRGLGLPHAQELHERVMDALKSVRAGHLAYQAAILYPSDQRLPLITQPTLVTCAPKDSPWPYIDGVSRLVKHATKRPHPHDNPIGRATDAEIANLAAMLSDWLDG